MGSNDQAFLQQLLATFSVEAVEHIAALSSGLVELERTDSAERRMEIVEIVFRDAYSLKGAARAVNLAKVEAICQALEAAFAEMKTPGSVPAPPRLDELHQMVSAVAAEVEVIGASPPAVSPASPSGKPYRDPQSGTPTEAPAGLRLAISGAQQKEGLPETVRVSKAKLASLLRQAEELVSTKGAAAHRSAQLREIIALVGLWERDWHKVRRIIRARQQPSGVRGPAGGDAPVSDDGKQHAAGPTSLSELAEQSDRTLKSIKCLASALAQGLESDGRGLERRVTGLLDDVKRVSMLPFSTLLSGFPRMVRDLCRDCGKDVELTIEGGDIEADRRVFEEIKDPLIHLVRNSIDHGVELPADRERAQKRRRATVAIAVSAKSGGGVDVTISDDGAGVDVANVRAAALNLHLLSPEEAEQMDDRQVLPLIFHSGLSTSPRVTHVSGRGLGLAIVREKIEKIGGAAHIESERGRGTTFRLTLPLTFATFQGLLVRIDEQFFVLPGMHVYRALRISSRDIRRVENREVAEFEGKPVCLVRLAEVLGIGKQPKTVQARDNVSGVLLTWASQRMLFLVDEILGVHEFVVKSLGKQLARVRNISGTTVLPSGKIALVLNAADLIRSGSGIAPPSPDRASTKQKKSVLVVDDSITTRTLLRGVLESAGYQVRTAVDGVDALAALDSQPCDLVLSDVEMPRLSGFDLTAQIRANRKLSNLPVVLVTALESRSDRERGAEVGANYYLVKGGFDQSNLLEAVERLI
jgi:two-component system, chemotaxis family, sensor kinase CheA